MSVSPNGGGQVQPARENSASTPPVYYPVTPLGPGELPPPAMPASWHPDPTNPGLLRYWDGVQWTEHRQAQTPVATATVYNNVRVSGGGSDAVLHLLLTIFTCGLWLPIWILIELVKAISR